MAMRGHLSLKELCHRVRICSAHIKNIRKLSETNRNAIRHNKERRKLSYFTHNMVSKNLHIFAYFRFFYMFEDIVKQFIMFYFM